MGFHNLATAITMKRITVDGTNWEFTANTTAGITSGSIDTNGYDACEIVTIFGTLSTSSVVTQTYNSSPDNSTWSAMKYGAGAPGQTAGTAISNTVTAAAGNTKEIMITDIYRPTARYVQAVTVIATGNGVIDAMIANLYKADYFQAQQDATVAAQLVINHPSN